MTLAVGEEIYREHESFIKKTAHSLSRSFWKVEEEDILQEIWIFLWQKEKDFREQCRSDAYIRVSIRNVATNYALKQRNKTLVETDTFYYHADELRAVLPDYFDSMESWPTAPVPPGAETMTKNDNVEIFCDIARVWDRLTDTQQAILVRKYMEDEDLSEGKERQALSRAVRRLLELLNQDKDKAAKAHQGPGSRRAITNAQGRYLVNDNA